MQTHNLKQGTPDWDKFRLDHFGASEAPVMLGISSKMTRNELLKIRHTGIQKEFSKYVEEVLFENGHEAEANARELIEEEIGDDLYPVVCSDGIYSASCDGLTMDGKLAFEHKLWNQELAEDVGIRGRVPDEYMAQCQQILMVTGAKSLLFMVSDGTMQNREYEHVYPEISWFKRIKQGWKQFQSDLDNYTPKEIKEKPQASAIMQLPTLSIQIKGEVIASNLPQFKADAEEFIANINTNLTTDEDFVNAEATVKYCKETEEKLETAKAAAIAQTASIDEVMRTIDFIKEELRKKRLDLDKKVKNEKEAIKSKIVADSRKAFNQYVENLSKEVNPIILNVEQPDFGGQMKGKKTLESLHNAADTELARCKILADEIAGHVRANLKWFHENVGDNAALFRDLQSIIYKDFDDLKLLFNSRIEEQKRKIEEAEKAAAERAKIESENNKVKEKILDHVKTQSPVLSEQEKIDRIGQLESESKKLTSDYEENKKRVMAEAKDSLRLLNIKCDTEKVINAIADGSVKHVSINF